MIIVAYILRFLIAGTGAAMAASAFQAGVHVSFYQACRGTALCEGVWLEGVGLIIATAVLWAAARTMIWHVTFYVPRARSRYYNLLSYCVAGFSAGGWFLQFVSENI